MTLRRRVALGLLVANGLAQAAVSLGLVMLVREASDEVRAASVSTASLALGAIALGLLLFGLRILQKRQGEAMALGYTGEIRVRLVEQIFAMPADAGRARLGLMMTRLITDLSAIKNWLADGLASLFVALPSVTTIVGGAFFLAPSIAPILLAGVLVWVTATLLASPFLGKAIRESRRRRGRMSARLGDIVLARSTLVHFGRGGPTTRRVERMSERLNASLVTRAGWSGTTRASSDLVLPAIIACLTGFALTQMPTVTPHDVGILLLLSGLVVAQLADLARAADYRLAYREARRRLGEILGLDLGGDPEDAMPLSRVSEGRTITLSLPSTSGGQTPPHRAAPGSVVVVKGQDEAARRRLLHVIAEPSRTIEIGLALDDIPLRRVTARDHRRAITLVSPSMPLIRGTIFENVTIGAPSDIAPDEIVRIAASMGIAADALEDAARLDPSHADPRLAVALRAARALLRRSVIILVDDPDLTRNEVLMPAFLAEAKAIRATVVLSEDQDDGLNADAIWDISGAVLPSSSSDQSREDVAEE